MNYVKQTQYNVYIHNSVWELFVVVVVVVDVVTAAVVDFENL